MTIVRSAVVLVLLIGSGFGDGRGFVHSSRIWSDDGFQATELVRAGSWFTMGIGLYWVSLFWARKAGVESAIIQTFLWFAAAIIGVAVASREFGTWAVSDKVLAAALATGLGVLLVRHA